MILEALEEGVIYNNGETYFVIENGEMYDVDEYGNYADMDGDPIIEGVIYSDGEDAFYIENGIMYDVYTDDEHNYILAEDGYLYLLDEGSMVKKIKKNVKKNLEKKVDTAMANTTQAPVQDLVQGADVVKANADKAAEKLGQEVKAIKKVSNSAKVQKQANEKALRDKIDTKHKVTGHDLNRAMHKGTKAERIAANKSNMQAQKVVRKISSAKDSAQTFINNGMGERPGVHLGIKKASGVGHKFSKVTAKPARSTVFKKASGIGHKVSNAGANSTGGILHKVTSNPNALKVGGGLATAGAIAYGAKKYYDYKHRSPLQKVKAKIHKITH